MTALIDELLENMHGFPFPCSAVTWPTKDVTVPDGHHIPEIHFAMEDGSRFPADVSQDLSDEEAMKMLKKVIVAYYDAMGGPSKPEMGDDGFIKKPTTKGSYVLSSCGRHVSARYPLWSSIPWGTRLKEEKKVLKVYMNGKWQPLSKFTIATKEDIMQYNLDLYNKYALPDRWVFNDFGHMTCYYFRDINHNGVIDKNKESILGEFIHTTPVDEADNTLPEATVKLEGSHGCIHVKPDDIDEMIRKGYLKKGNLVVVHSYTQDVPISRIGIGKPPFEFHFYPKSSKVVIYGNK